MNNGGAIASWSPSGYGVSSGHDQLDRSLMNNFFNNYEYQLGYLTTHAKYDLFAQTSGFEDLIETYPVWRSSLNCRQALRRTQLLPTFVIR